MIIKKKKRPALILRVLDLTARTSPNRPVGGRLTSFNQLPTFHQTVNQYKMEYASESKLNTTCVNTTSKYANSSVGSDRKEHYEQGLFFFFFFSFIHFTFVKNKRKQTSYVVFNRFMN